MASNDCATTGLLRLPIEIILAISKLEDPTDAVSLRTGVYSLRRGCRHLYTLCDNLVDKRSTTIDTARPQTLALLRSVIANPAIAEGIHEVYVRLHFYHPWIAASLDNFTSSVKKEWASRLPFSGNPTAAGTDGRLSFDNMMHILIEHLKLPEDSESRDLLVCEEYGAAASSRILRQAYRIYKDGCDAQDRLLRGENFPQELVQTLSRLPNVRTLVFHDGDLQNNRGPGTDSVDAMDGGAQENALATVLSRPMLWEEVRWIVPPEHIWPGVPIDLLYNIPLALGKAGGIYIDYLRIELSAAPDYVPLQLEAHRWRALTAAVEAMDLFQFAFSPCCRSSCGPWEVDGDGAHVYATRTPEELHPINQYLGALNAKNISHADINLGDFWTSVGLSSIFDMPCSLGAAFSWPVGSALRAVRLTSVCLTVAELERLSRALQPDCEVDLDQVRLIGGTWRSALDTLRQGLRSPLRAFVYHPFGGDLDQVDYHELQTIFNQEPEKSQATRFTLGEDIVNPLQFQV